MEPKVWIGCLASRNAGNLFGEWFDVNDYADPSDLIKAVKEMLEKSPEQDAEEWYIGDYERFGDSDEIDFDEYEPLENIWNVAQFLEKHGEPGIAAITLSSSSYDDLTEAEQLMEENYQGHYDNDEAFAEEIYLSVYDVPDNLLPYIDWSAVARDLMMDYMEEDGYYFRR